MSKYINWYVVEIEKRLQGRLPQDRVQELVQEVEQHLESAKEELGDERKAIARFGPVEQIAENLVRGNAEIWRFSSIAAKTVIWLTVLGASSYMLGDILDQVFYVEWLPIIVVFFVLIVIGSLCARRILIMQFSFIMVAGVLATALYFGATRYDLGRIDGEDLVRKPSRSALYERWSAAGQVKRQTYEEKMTAQQIREAEGNSVLAQSAALLPKAIFVEVLCFSVLAIANLIGYGLAMIGWRLTKVRRKLLQS